LLVNLRELHCSWNQLTSLDGLDQLVNLTKLHCYENQLTSLEGLDLLVNLEVLDCSGNQLPSLDGLGAQEAVAQVKREMAAALVKGAKALGGDTGGGSGGGGGGGGGDDFGSALSARSRTGPDEVTPLGD
ncbi:MAG: leucine-rich repeat domain-containing protein, partial [Pseudomonadota bacterium]|nr:leucine-rich repeat domain-containing protein [Pseudomonadota bacterium]